MGCPCTPSNHGHLLLLLLLVFLPLSASAAFIPPDNYLLNCGATSNATVDTRTFLPDFTAPRRSPPWSLSSPESTAAAAAETGTNIPSLFRTARVFTTNSSSYTFPITHPGRHFLRLHFFPFFTPKYNLSQASFSVAANTLTLLSNLQLDNASTPILKEYLIPTTSVTTLVLSFLPSPSSSAFVNAIELVSAPDSLLDYAYLTSTGTFSLNSTTLETAYRVNMGGNALSPTNDTLSRSWVTDRSFLLHPNLATPVVSRRQVNYNAGETTPEIAPPYVYATAMQMANLDGSNQKFNITWQFQVDPSYKYLVRLHFCDVVSNSSNQLMFYVYVGGYNVLPDGLDLSSKFYNTLAVPYYMDVVLDVPGESAKLSVSVGPWISDRILPNAILNGLEVMKMNNSLGSLSGLGDPATNPESPSGRKPKSSQVILLVGIVLVGVGAVAVLIVVFFSVRRRKRREMEAVEKKSFNNWGSIPVVSRATTNATVNSVPSGVGYAFSAAALREATNGFSEELVIGVGGFGKVYRGVLKDQNVVAVKRGNQGSQQGFNEFRTEIELLSQLRHRHLVSLIGYCNERSEMILVYEYMEKGTLRSHLYGEGSSKLSWKQRLDICIGAARGLHYLHTGQAKPIIHRDVKSANILLDGDLVAKVGDFGLSKTSQLDKTHVSTAVKGSFGYLDPEYFRRQQLTEKSDVYSFGVVLLEVLCARPVIDPTLPREMVNLAEWALDLHRRGQLNEAIDPVVLETAEADSLAQFVGSAENCLADQGSKRPSMGDVLWKLETALQLQQVQNVHQTNGDLAECTRDSSPLVRNLRSSELDGSLVGEGFGWDDMDLHAMSMSRVFSQMVKN